VKTPADNLAEAYADVMARRKRDTEPTDAIIALSEATMRAYCEALDRGDDESARELRDMGWRVTSLIARLARERAAKMAEQAAEVLS
jgi:hypothetical protein